MSEDSAVSFSFFAGGLVAVKLSGSLLLLLAVGDLEVIDSFVVPLAIRVTQLLLFFSFLWLELH